ncbi:unnamed protein product [Timema podura]|uniref:Uncharacterized protein n=1 Tax=Timema podura TaxID=61482 RepID=A0ABN7PIY7_TIMPD|nr:unnamed protein product [Timema podura]
MPSILPTMSLAFRDYWMQKMSTRPDLMRSLSLPMWHHTITHLLA